MPIMPRKSKLQLPPLNLGKETLGQRIAKLRKERGFTQRELAEKMGIIQVLISDYENDKLRPHYEMIIRFIQALEINADEFLGIKPIKNNGGNPNKRVLRRVKKIEGLPLTQQKTLLKTIDTFIKANEK